MKVITCSFVVLPMATRQMWKPVNPNTGNAERPEIVMINILLSIKEQTDLLVYDPKIYASIYTIAKSKNSSEYGSEQCTTKARKWLLQ